MTTHYDIDPADKNIISSAIKSQRSTEQENVNMIWNEIVHEWRPKSETVFLRMGGWALPFLSSATAYEVGKHFMSRSKSNKSIMPKYVISSVHLGFYF